MGLIRRSALGSDPGAFRFLVDMLVGGERHVVDAQQGALRARFAHIDQDLSEAHSAQEEHLPGVFLRLGTTLELQRTALTPIHMRTYDLRTIPLGPSDLCSLIPPKGRSDSDSGRALAGHRYVGSGSGPGKTSWSGVITGGAKQDSRPPKPLVK
jgi:hypothetical protein